MNAWMLTFQDGSKLTCKGDYMRYDRRKVREWMKSCIRAWHGEIECIGVVTHYTMRRARANLQARMDDKHDSNGHPLMCIIHARINARTPNALMYEWEWPANRAECMDVEKLRCERHKLPARP